MMFSSRDMTVRLEDTLAGCPYYRGVGKCDRRASCSYAQEPLCITDEPLDGWGSETFTPHNEPNPVLIDVRKYRTERLKMNNPKGWDHILRKFEQAVKGGAYVTNDWERIATPEHIAHTRAVLTRLVGGVS